MLAAVPRTQTRRQLVEETWRALRISFMGLRGRIRAGGTQAGTSLSRMIVLRHLDSGGPTTSKDLADAMCVTSGNMPGLLDKLEADGLVQRTRSRDDRRRVYVAATPKGRGVLRRFRRDMVESLTAAFEGWTDADVGALRRLLVRLIPASSPVGRSRAGDKGRASGRAADRRGTRGAHTTRLQQNREA